MGGEVDAVINRRGAERDQGRLEPFGVREAVLRTVAVIGVAALSGLLSDRADWQPLSLVVALAATMIVADVLSVQVRRVRISAGLMVQVVAMALLGPAPAAIIGMLAALADALANRLRLVAALNNLAVFGFLGVLGGAMFEVLGAFFGFGTRDAAYAALVVPVSLLVTTLNLALVTATSPGIAPRDRRRVFRDSGLPTVPVECVLTLMATAAVFVWAHAGLAAAAALLLVLVISIPLLRTVGSALKTGDDLLALRQVSDQRAAEVARLASDRERLLSEVLNAEERERARLAESLHDGPMQTLAALRQDAHEAADGVASKLVAERLATAISETRAIISAYHPATVRELGFEASLRAAVAPFPSAEAILLTVDNSLDDRLLAGTLLLPVAQELAVNAVKHARPSKIDVTVGEQDADVVLRVSDDGVGIDTSDVGRKVRAGHLGLAMVRRRVEDAGGTLEIQTRSDGGTRTKVTLPATSL